MWTSQVNSEDYRSALENSLKLAGYLGNGDNSEKYLPSASLMELKQPLLGINMTVTCKTQYRLVDTRQSKEIYNKIIETPYTATFSDSAIGMTRLKIANERAVRENIKALVADLSTLNVPLATIVFE